MSDYQDTLTETGDVLPFPVFEDEIESQIDLKAYGEHAAAAFYGAIQNAANGTARSKQQQDHFIGISNLGHCKMYALLLMKQTPFSDKRDKTAAFFGTVAGEAIEAQLAVDFPQMRTQTKLVFPLPSGGKIPGTTDVLIPWEGSLTVEQFTERARFAAARAAGEVEGPEAEQGFIQGIWDGKSKAELETIKRYGPNRQQIFQVHAYAKAAIEAGLLNPDYPILVGDVFFDRSGRDVIPYGAFHVYREDVITFIDEWVNDVKHALLNGEDAEREMPREWCWSYCEYASICRGEDTDVSGLIEDPEILTAVEMYVEGKEMEKGAKKLVDAAKIVLERIPIGGGGSTGTHMVRATEVGEAQMKAYTRAGYRKLSITKVRVPTPKVRKAK